MNPLHPVALVGVGPGLRRAGCGGLGVITVAAGLRHRRGPGRTERVDGSRLPRVRCPTTP